MPVLKMVEVGVLLLAVIGFAWWQLRDVKRAQAQQRARTQTDAAVQPNAPSVAAQTTAHPDSTGVSQAAPSEHSQTASRIAPKRGADAERA